jgi:hypothetical protein
MYSNLALPDDGSELLKLGLQETIELALSLNASLWRLASARVSICCAAMVRGVLADSAALIGRSPIPVEKCNGGGLRPAGGVAWSGMPRSIWAN